MKKALPFIFFLAILLQAGISKACTCAYIGTFCETITYNSEVISPYLCVIRGTVISQESDRMKVKVVDHLGGAVPSASEVFIISGNGANCGEFTGGFEVGKDFVFAMNTGWGMNEDSYSLSICGVSFLRINNNIVEGKIAPGINSVSYNKLGTINDCGNLSLSKKIGLFSIYPTLTSTGPSIFLDSDASDPVGIEWEMFSNIGQLIAENKSQTFEPGDQITIDMEHYPTGVYLLRLQRAGERKVFKIVKI